MAAKDWKFKEEQREDVSNGKLCPRCLNTKIKDLGGIPWATIYGCCYCHETWEGN